MYYLRDTDAQSSGCFYGYSIISLNGCALSAFATMSISYGSRFVEQQPSSVGHYDEKYPPNYEQATSARYVRPQTRGNLCMGSELTGYCASFRWNSQFFRHSCSIAA